jgi:hypothetical protein
MNRSTRVELYTGSAGISRGSALLRRDMATHLTSPRAKRRQEPSLFSFWRQDQYPADMLQQRLIA